MSGEIRPSASSAEKAEWQQREQRQSRSQAPLGLVVAAFAAVYLIWGSTYLGIRLAIESIPPFLMAGSRFLCSGVILYTIMRARGIPRPEPRQWISAAVIGALLLLVGNGGVSWAEQMVPSGIASLVIATTPLWMLLIEWLRPGGARPTLRVLFGLAAGFAGVALIVVSRNQLGSHLVHPAGAIALVAASICWASGSIYSRHASKPASALLAIGMQMIAGGGLLLLAGLVLGEARHFDPFQITAASAWAFLYLTIAGGLVGFTAYVWLLQVSTPARVSTYAYVNPFIAVLLGHLVLKEQLPATILLAGVLILTAVILITRTARK